MTLRLGRSRRDKVREQNPRALAAHGLADAVVKALEMNDSRAAEAAAQVRLSFVTALDKREAG